MEPLNESSLTESLKWINQKLTELTNYQREQNGNVARHEKWINQREAELDRMNDRFRMIEETQDEHQSYIDQKTPMWAEFDIMRVRMDKMETAQTLTQGAKTGLKENLQFIATVVTLGVLLLKTLKVIP